MAGMASFMVVPVDVACNVGACLADGVVGLEVHALVLDRTPDALDKHVVPPRPASLS